MFDGQVYRVARGSGMGTVLSGELCDIVFFYLVGKNYISTERFMRFHKIRMWLRYRDDLLVLYTDTMLAKKFVDFIRKRIQCLAS